MDDIMLYITKQTTELSEEELIECAKLFSSSYGKYNSGAEDDKVGKQIKMPVSYYKNNYCQKNFYVAMAKLGNKLVGHAFYLRKDYSGLGGNSEKNYGKMTWVLQLVVDENYRRRGIASTLLRSIWGFSDDYAWGLATTNPCTVKTLESATFRKCSPMIIADNMDAVNLIGKDIAFVRDAEYYVDGVNSQINTEFYVDNSEFVENDDCEKQLGILKPGYEWLAFTFQNQSIDMGKYTRHFEAAMTFSESSLKDAYSRMNIGYHAWAKGTINEVDFIENYVTEHNQGSILDIGCGTGRHAIELAKRGYDVKGIDFSEKHIAQAHLNLEKEKQLLGSCKLECIDARNYTNDEAYDYVVCLYDVVGSFPDSCDNEAVIRTCYDSLKTGGRLILSVMNMELTEYIVPDIQKGKLMEKPDILMKLAPGNIMQESGNIFNPKHIAIDTEHDLVYRKEQFGDDLSLSAEYVIRDKRYRMAEIVAILERIGFKVLDKRYVRAGHFDENLNSLDEHAKEICIVAEK